MNVELLRVLALLPFLMAFTGRMAQADDGLEFFEQKIRPALVEHCYECHSANALELKAELRLDLKAGWQLGGESGEPAVIPGNPDESPLILSIRHAEGISAMPPKRARLPESTIADLTAWVKMGAPDPRNGALQKRDKPVDWESAYRSRLDWWSLKPVQNVAPPNVLQADWPRTAVDRFVLARLEAQGLQPGPEAGRRVLARRLSLVLTGLPCEPDRLEQFVADSSATAYDDLVTTLLDSPHFGEWWARHWMDVVHYSDTHGYEWDVPAKNAWRYRDYLVRAFNADVPYRQLVLEQIAGDLLEPRLDAISGLNEALMGPMALRLGERRHGDNAGAEGVTQEAVSNMVDTLGKAFLGTTLACAQCHDHKLDAVEQRDYYAVAGVLMSTRFSARTLDVSDLNTPVIEELRGIKQQLRAELAKSWLEATDPDKPADSGKPGDVATKLKAIAADEKPATNFPATLVEFWKRSLNSPVTADEFAKEREQRIAANSTQLKLLADFTAEADAAGRTEAAGQIGAAGQTGAAGWKWDGLGMKTGLVRDGELVVSDEGDTALLHLLPAGRFSHVWSQRLAGSLQSPQLDPTSPVTFSVEIAAGKFASQSFIVDRALHSERLQFMKRPLPGWLTLSAGNFDSLEGSIDKAQRLVYFEVATKSLNNYFPPRVGYGGASEAEVTDPRSWFGVTRVYQHAPGQPPQDELGRFAALYAPGNLQDDWSRRLTQTLRGAVERWSQGTCTREDVLLLNDALQAKLLPNELASHPELARLVGVYRATEQKLQPDRTIGTAADWNEGRNERIGIRGSYTDLGDAVERGGIRFLGGAIDRTTPSASGRLELARRIVDDRNPLTARVYVNRVWQYLYGKGLVRTPDDFGHLGEQPTHPELLDYLAARFMHEGWSTKKLVRLLVTSATWRQGSVPDPRAVELDPDNRLWHHLPMRRLDAEAIRDSMLAVAGRLDRTLGGPPIEPYRTAEDAQKRLFKGPLDGNGRRSLYTEMTLMEPPRFLALFNQPLPKATVGSRDVTNVPDQALALLNDPFVIAMAQHWSQQLVAGGSSADNAASLSQRAERMLVTALARPPNPAETDGLLKLVEQSGARRGIHGAALLTDQPAWQDAAHALFNLKEFIYVP